MDADWYVDPLGRFDGRFFDGERWTERVSADGAMAIDSEFATETPVEHADGLPAQDTEPDAPAVADDFESGGPAVERVEPRRPLTASLIEESPARTVAVLDGSVTRFPDAEKPASGRSSRTPIVWGLLGLIAALVVAGLVLLNNDDGSPAVIREPAQLDTEQAARVEDLEAGGSPDELQGEPIEELDVDAPAGAVAPGTTFAASETIAVGGLRILNGESLLADLGEWHREFATQRGVELAPSAACWFGQLGGAAVQAAHCGPVGGSAASEFLFDTVPLVFEEANGGQIAQPVIDAAVTDAVLANALTLIGREDHPPPLSLEGATRGDRNDESGD